MHKGYQQPNFQFLSSNSSDKFWGSPLVARHPYLIVPSVCCFIFLIPSCNLVRGLVSPTVEEDP